MEVRAARDLPDMESWISKIVNPKDVTDPFVDVKLGSAQLVKTSIIDNTLNPEWNEEYRIEVSEGGVHTLSNNIKN
jgi:Ca2+-dependent lipid-binding protein